uniref:bifunctional DNA primase/polymerase n=1 Tax=uncultured Mycobacterium sp. TaxID=171292 RepID=UPI0035C964D0
MTAAVYAAAYDTYRQRGWAPIKLAAHTKWPPPPGFTGHEGGAPSYPDCCAWAEEEPGGNIAIRLPAGMIGIDVDAYDGETGAQTLAEAEKRWGRLPYSPRSSSRDDAVSGVRLYRIPAGMVLPGQIGFPELGIGDVEICQRHHRYVMCWPSIHPSGRQYRWLGIDGAPIDVPYPADIPDLPPAWLKALARDDDHARNNTDLGEEAYDINAAVTEGEPSQRVLFKLSQAMTELYGPSRHDAILARVAGLLRLGKQGEPGVKRALQALREAFANTVGPDRPGGRKEAITEFNRMVTGKRIAQL